MFKRIVIISIMLGAAFFPEKFALAGFGVSPPAIASDKILPGAHYEQMLVLLRADAEAELFATVKISAPEIADWIRIDKGLSFAMPAGASRVPIIASIDPPANAPLGNYQGKIEIFTSEKNAGQTSGIALATGAQVAIDISLTRDIFRDFLVKTVFVEDVQLLHWPWNSRIFSKLYGKLRVSVKIENSGNVKIAPAKVALDIYDISEENLLLSAEDNTLKKIKPFQTGEIKAALPISLAAGQYWAKIKVYKDNDIISYDKAAFTVLPAGAFTSADLIPWLILIFALIFFWLFLKIALKIDVSKIFFSLMKFIKSIAHKAQKQIKKVYAHLKSGFWRRLYKLISKNKK